MDGLLRFLRGDYLALWLVMATAVGILIFASVVLMSGSAEAWENLSETFQMRTTQWSGS